MTTIAKDVDGYSCWSSRWLGIQWQFKPEHCHWWELTANAKHQHRRDFNHVQLRLGRWFSARIYFPVIFKPGEVSIPSQWSESGFRTEYIPKRYGFCIAGDQYTIYYGTDPGDDSYRDRVKRQTKTWWPGYTKRRNTEWTVFGADGKIHAQYIGNDCNGQPFFDMCAAKRTVTRRQMVCVDYDGQEIIASYHVNRRVYKRGTGWFRWLSYLTKSDVHHMVEIDFDKEVGNEKGSWKGGTLGVTVLMQEDETPEQAIVRWIQEERSKDNQHTRHRIDLMLKSWGTTKENQQ